MVPAAGMPLAPGICTFLIHFYIWSPETLALNWSWLTTVAMCLITKLLKLGVEWRPLGYRCTPQLSFLIVLAAQTSSDFSSPSSSRVRGFI